MTLAKMVKAVVSVMLVLAFVAMSTANLVDHTNNKSAPTIKIPRSVFSVACSRYPFPIRHNHCMFEFDMSIIAFKMS